MTYKLPTLSHENIESLLTGELPDESLASLAGLLADMRTSVDTSPLPVLGNELAAFLDGTHVPEPMAAAIPARTRPAPIAFVKKAMAKVAGKIAVGLAGLLVLGTAGTAGALPSPLQHAVAQAADVVGVELPGNGHHLNDKATTPDAATAAADAAEEAQEVKDGTTEAVEPANDATGRPVVTPAAGTPSPAARRSSDSSSPSSATPDVRHDGTTSSDSSNRGSGSGHSGKGSDTVAGIDHAVPDTSHATPESESPTSTTIDLSHKPTITGAPATGSPSGSPIGTTNPTGGKGGKPGS